MVVGQTGRRESDRRQRDAVFTLPPGFRSDYVKEDAEKLQGSFQYCHVPIDRYVANPIVNELGVNLPRYNGFQMPKHVPFDAGKCNYSWSKINDYSDYLNCQKYIREALRKANPMKYALEWEFIKWLDEKNNT